MIYAFAEYELDTTRYEFRRAGKPHRLEPQVFNVLAYLVSHRHRVVTKHELLEHLWPEQFVSDATLYQRLKAARRALGDSGSAQRVIQTVHGRGYRFVAVVEAYEDQTPGSQETVTEARRSDAWSAPTTHYASRHTLAGEHKLVTVVSGALADTTALAHLLGPNGLRRLLQWLWRIVHDEVQRYDGAVHMAGDNDFMAIFGVPVAYEDHAQRAVFAALDLHQRLRQGYTDPDTQQRLELALCLGIHSGRVMIDWHTSEGPWPALVVGQAIDLARHVQYRAAPGTLVVSEATRQLVHGDVESVPCAALQVPGQDEPVPAYSIRHRKGGYTPVVLHGGRRLTRFVGREHDMATLQALLAQATAGQGQVVGIMGEPGTGKSRLLYEWSQRLPERQVGYLEGQCVSHSSATPYTPVLAILRQACGITDADDADTIVARVQQRVQDVGLPLEVTAPYLLHLLGVTPDNAALAKLSPQTIKSRTFTALQQLSLHSSQEQPLVLAIENVHWIDATSEAWLASLVDQLANAPLLLLTTYRPGYRPPWLEKSYATQLALAGLTSEESLRLVHAVLGPTQVPDELIQQMLHKAAGNPFFLEEFARSVRDLGAPRHTLEVPDTVQAVLAARIDRLPAAVKSCLQAAAMIGKDVSLALLQEVAELPETTLEQYLQHLQTAEFLYEVRGQAERVYTFKHALTQDVVYQSLVRQTQQQMHRRIAQVLVERFPHMIDTQPEVLAQHYTAAGQHEDAVDFWYQAGLQARERAAYREAISHLQKGLEVLTMLPDTAVRAPQELRLQRTLAASLVALKGWTAPDIGHAYVRARELCQHVDDPAQLVPVLCGLRDFYLVRAELQTARELAEELLRVVQRGQTPAWLWAAHQRQAHTLFHLGDFVAAHGHFEHAVGVLTSERLDNPVRLQPDGLDPLMHCLAWWARVLWSLGYPAQGRQRIDEALTLARQLAYPFNLVSALSFGTVFHWWYSRDRQTFEQLTAESLALATEHGFAQSIATRTIRQGVLLITQGDHESGQALVSQGLEAYRATGSAIRQPGYYAEVAEAYRETAQAKQGLAAVTAGFEYVERTGERWCEAELYRIKGELLRDAGGDTQETAWTPERCFHQALSIARRQSAKSLELRAATSLSRLWQQQGKQAAARQLLAPLYDWFTEGFDTADLQDARALLEELGG